MSEELGAVTFIRPNPSLATIESPVADSDQVRPFSLSTLRFATLVVLAIVNGAVPVATLEVNTWLVLNGTPEVCTALQSLVAPAAANWSIRVPCVPVSKNTCPGPLDAGDVEVGFSLGLSSSELPSNCRFVKTFLFAIVI